MKDRRWKHIVKLKGVTREELERLEKDFGENCHKQISAKRLLMAVDRYRREDVEK